MIDLYTWGTPNGRKVSIMLEETGLPYRVHKIDISKGDQFKPEFVAINPNSKIPAIVDPEGPGGKALTLFESGAILIYLADKSGKLMPKDPSGRYNVLEVDTHGPFKGPRAYDASGLPLAFDNESIFKERFHLDKNDPNVFHNEITVFDHALTRPWSVDKTFRRNPNPRPSWRETSCTEGNNQVIIGKENYFLSADGQLMPTKKDQAPPSLKYFKQTQN